MRSAKFILAQFAWLFVLACAGGDDDASKPTISTSGTIYRHPVTSFAPAGSLDGLTFAGAQITVWSVDDLFIANAVPRHVWDIDIHTTGCLDAVLCPFHFTDIDASNSNTGMVVDVVDTNATSPQWAATGNLLMDGATLANTIATKQSYDAAFGFALPMAVLDRVVGPLLDLTGAELLQRGFVLGMVVGKASEFANGMIPPAAGASLTVAHPEAAVYYPNASFTGPNDTQSTASHGYFLIYRKTYTVDSGHLLVPIEVAGSSSDSHVWAPANMLVKPTYTSIWFSVAAE